MEGDNTSGKVKHNGESDASAEQALHSHVSEDKTNNDTQDDLVNPANDEHQGKLLLIHFGLCLCTFLVGLVSSRQNFSHFYTNKLILHCRILT